MQKKYWLLVENKKFWGGDARGPSRGGATKLASLEGRGQGTCVLQLRILFFSSSNLAFYFFIYLRFIIIIETEKEPLASRGGTLYYAPIIAVRSLLTS